MARQILVFVVKFGITIGAVAYLIASRKLQLTQLRVSSEAWYWIPVAGLLVLSHMTTIQCRLWLLLRANGIQLTLGQVIRIGLASWFLNASLLGGLGFLSSDAVRAVFLAQHSDRKAAIVGAVFIDRVVGLLGLLTLASFSLLIALRTGIGADKLGAISTAVYFCLTLMAIAGTMLIVVRNLGRTAAWIVATLLCVAAAVLPQFARVAAGGYWTALAVLLIVAAVLPTVIDSASLVRLAGTNSRIGRLIVGAVMTVTGYRKKFGSVLLAYLSALLTHAVSVLALFVLAHGIRIGAAPTLAQVLFAAPISFLTAALPLPANGLGVGEAAFDMLLRLSQAPTAADLTAGAALYLGYRILNMLAALVGLPFFLFSKRADRPAHIQP